MLNFRKMKQDFSPAILKEGKQLYDQHKIVSAKIIRLDTDTIRFNSRILGKFDNTYESEIEIDRFESQAVHTNCDCPSRYDCQHLAALIFFLEEKMDALLIAYSKEADITQSDALGAEEKEELIEVIEEAKSKEVEKEDARQQKLVLQEYVAAAHTLSSSPFFLKKDPYIALTQAELAVIFNPHSLTQGRQKTKVEFQLALRLPFRTKPLQISQMKVFLDAIRHEEPIFIAGRKLLLSMKCFDEIGSSLLQGILVHARFNESAQGERAQRIAYMDLEAFGTLLHHTSELAMNKQSNRGFKSSEDEMPELPNLYLGTLETPLRYSESVVSLRFALEYIEPPSPKLLLKPQLVTADVVLGMDEVVLFECMKPGMLYQDTYYRFGSHIRRTHLLSLATIRSMTIPEPLFGTFVENSLPELKHFADVTNTAAIEKFVTLPFTGKLGVRCHLSYLDGELEGALYFNYGGQEIPAAPNKLGFETITSFVTADGIVSRNLVEEKAIIDNLFQDFTFNANSSTYVAKTEKKIVEFMTGIVPRYQHQVDFECPQNLLEQFLYDATEFTLKLDASKTMGYYEIDLKVNGALKGIKLELLWECLSAKRAYLELDAGKTRKEASPRFSKILVLDLERIRKIVQLFDELGIKQLSNQKEKRPLWNLVTIDPKTFDGLPVSFTMSESLLAIRSQMLGEIELKASEKPQEVQAELRPYQLEGVQWLERLRLMYLNGILADDMGLGKTLQAITAITQHKLSFPNAQALIICPTSLLYNWQEELNRFNPNLCVTVVDGVPAQRKKILGNLKKYDVIITSYTLLQKDVEIYAQESFGYSILDEAQHIKNRGTRNAKSVKMIQAAHRLILTGTPIENSLEDMWSLMDYLMPGFLSTFDRFAEKYVRTSGAQQVENMHYLRKKISPFIMRRMKVDVLKDLPPIDEIIYHCQLSDTQMELYKSYAQTARDELVKLVERDGFDKVQIHILATLTRLKQICCHPAIFAKEKVESGDSAKYEMLLELLKGLMEGNHKTVIFSQYTRMLQIMREDLEQRGIRFSYLDGSSKNRLQLVKEFNEDPKIPIFLVSLKAGGTGLNLVGADTVIHYDMWWNPAVENQATDRVYRMGQKKSISSYKLITKNTIEEKIVEMQKRKKGLVKKVISCDDEAIAKLTWEDVLELLQT